MSNEPAQRPRFWEVLRDHGNVTERQARLVCGMFPCYTVNPDTTYDRGDTEMVETLEGFLGWLGDPPIRREMIGSTEDTHRLSLDEVSLYLQDAPPSKDTEAECPICRGPPQDPVQFTCECTGHCCRSCITDWLVNYNARCPTCRGYPVLSA